MYTPFPRALLRNRLDDQPTDSLPPGEYASGGEYLVDYCPSCHKYKHFYFNPTRKLVLKNGDEVTGFGWCHVCNYKIIGWAQFKKIFAGDLKYVPPPKNEVRVQRETRISHPDQWDNAWDHPRSRSLMLERRLKESIVRQVPIGFVEEEDAVVAEIDPVTRELPQRVIYRRLSGGLQKWICLPGTAMANYGFGLRHLNKGLRAVVVMEGTFDLLSSGLLGYGVALLGTALNDSWASWIKSRFSAVAIWLDPDDAGMAGSGKISSRLDKWGIPHKVIHNPVEPKNHCPTDFSIQDLKRKLEMV